MSGLGLALEAPQLSLDEACAREPEDRADDELDDEGFTEEVGEIVDRLDVLRRHVDDLRLIVEDPILARRELRNIEEEIAQVRAAMTAAYGEDA